MIALAWEHNRESCAIEVTLETNGLCSLSHYHTYTHMISHDGQFFMVFRYEIPHVTYCKLNTGISNKLASQHERTITKVGVHVCA